MPKYESVGYTLSIRNRQAVFAEIRFYVDGRRHFDILTGHSSAALALAALQAIAAAWPKKAIAFHADPNTGHVTSVP